MKLKNKKISYYDNNKNKIMCVHIFNDNMYKFCYSFYKTGELMFLCTSKNSNHGINLTFHYGTKRNKTFI